MIKISHSKLLAIFTKLLILLAMAKALALGLWWYLPNDGVELNVKQNYQPKYQKVDFSNMISKAQGKDKNGVLGGTNSTENISITNMVLKGLYKTDTFGYVIVAMKSTPKETTIVAMQEEYQGYTLKSIEFTNAIFQRQGKDFILSLENMDKSSINVVKNQSNEQEPSSSNVSRADIAFFAKDPAQIWKDISIVEVKDADKIVGFKVTKINPKSKFISLGLKENDLIIKLNNVTIESYKDAIEIYNNIDKIDTIQIVVIRENQEKELVYEIR
ncbi:MAG: PDZ domain-containing protein [Campylobacterales bacterium]|nr:PDZ domain-containing protein [Campylobacterales bacterium]